MIDKQALHSLDKRQRVALINSLPGFKPVVLVGTVNDDNRTNLCVINSCSVSYTHLTLPTTEYV